MVELYLHSPIRLHGVVSLIKHRDNFTFLLVDVNKWFMATLTIIVLPFAGKSGSKGNVKIDEWSACKPTAHVVARSCRKFEKHCFRGSILVQFHSETSKPQGPGPVT
jgi:hypothetical protein